MLGAAASLFWLWAMNGWRKRKRKEKEERERGTRPSYRILGLDEVRQGCGKNRMTPSAMW